jgi:hypothetical protein
MTVRANALSQELDVQGSVTRSAAMTKADEALDKGVQISTGTGDTIGGTAPDMTLTDAGASFTVQDVGRYITIAGAPTGANDGTFLITSYSSGTSIGYENAAGVAEAAPAAAWEINKPYSLEDDLNFTRTDRKDIKGTSSYEDAIPTYVRPSAIGTSVDKNLTNLLSVDGYAKVRNVRFDDIMLRPKVTDGDGILAISDETFTTTDFHFTSDDLNSFITISGSTDADGSYRIKTVSDGQTLELDGLASATAEGSITWVLESDLKGILSSRGYADTVDRRGVPIADSGAEDETVYNATFAEMFNLSERRLPTTEAGLAVFARQYGDDKDPNATVGNEGTRFFVQLITGDNDGTATESELENISGRSGSAATIAGGDKVIGGLTGMDQADVGRYITVYATGNDQAGHYEIASVDSATSVTVVRAAGNFAADANTGSIEWTVSQHTGTWSFFTGDRYRLDEIDEAADRTTLIGGVTGNADIVQDITEIREFIGAADGDVTPGLTNTGADFPFSDLTDPADTDLESAVNVLNEQIGDRQYTGSVLADGETCTASHQALADAIAATSITRVIERLSADIDANTAHTLPGGNTYTLDGTDNGLNMYVFWRGLLRDPGAVVDGDDYDETSTTQITPYTKIKSGDHISYLILQ